MFKSSLLLRFPINREPNSILSEHTRFKINSAYVVHEIIDGEAILIHLTKGYYYSLDKTGTTIWNLIAQEISWKQLFQILSEHFGHDLPGTKEIITGFIQELHQEELILFQESGVANGSLPKNGITNDTENGYLAFEKPILQKFTDMKDFLLVDPIHEVNETGWPHKKS